MVVALLRLICRGVRKFVFDPGSYLYFGGFLFIVQFAGAQTVDTPPPKQVEPSANANKPSSTPNPKSLQLLFDNNGEQSKIELAVKPETKGWTEQWGPLALGAGGWIFGLILFVLQDQSRQRDRREDQKNRIRERKNERTSRDKEREKERDDRARERIEDILVTSLSYFEGGTQKRNVGIALIEAHWDNERCQHLRPMWRFILMNQATYLLTKFDEKNVHQSPASGSRDDYLPLHEVANLSRIKYLLHDDWTKRGERQLKREKTALPMTPEEAERYQSELDEISGEARLYHTLTEHLTFAGLGGSAAVAGAPSHTGVDSESGQHVFGQMKKLFQDIKDDPSGTVEVKRIADERKK